MGRWVLTLIGVCKIVGGRMRLCWLLCGIGEAVWGICRGLGVPWVGAEVWVEDGGFVVSWIEKE